MTYFVMSLTSPTILFLLTVPQPTYPQISIPTSSVVSPTAFFVLPYLLFDPVNQFPFLFNSEESKLLCPLCNRAGLCQGIVDSNQWRNGKSAHLQPCLIHDISSPILLVSKLYTCGNGHREIAGCDPNLIKQFPDGFVNFVTSHKSGMTNGYNYRIPRNCGCMSVNYVTTQLT